jgi:hypothetical protein
MRLTCDLTVSSVTTRRAAISGFDRPSATRRRTCVSRGVRVASAPVAGASALGRRRVNSLIRRRVTAGASRASPAAITRTASNSRSAVTSLSRKPLAPAHSASYT